MWFHSCFEEIQAFRSIGIGLYFLATCIVYLWHFAHKGYYITQEFHQTAYSHIFSCTHAEYGEDRPSNKSFAYAFTQFILCQGFFFKKLFHQGFIVFCRSLNQGFMQLHSLFHFFCRNIFYDWCSAFGFPTIFFHQQHIY